MNESLLCGGLHGPIFLRSINVWARERSDFVYARKNVFVYNAREKKLLRYFSISFDLLLFSSRRNIHHGSRLMSAECDTTITNSDFNTLL